MILELCANKISDILGLIVVRYCSKNKKALSCFQHGRSLRNVHPLEEPDLHRRTILAFLWARSSVVRAGDS